MVSGFCVLSFICFPHEFVFGTFGSLAGITLCSFVLLPRHGFVINLFFILLSGRSAVGNMSVGGLKPHVLGELDLGICFNLSTFDILNWKLQKLALSVCAWNFVSFFSIFMFFRSVFASFSSSHSGTLFSSGVSALPWRSNLVYSLASSLHCA